MQKSLVNELVYISIIDNTWKDRSLMRAACVPPVCVLFCHPHIAVTGFPGILHCMAMDREVTFTQTCVSLRKIEGMGYQ